MGRLVIPIHEIESDEVSPLRPLLQNECVALSIHDMQMFKKKRVESPVLLISPMSLYGFDSNEFLFSVPGYGSEVIDISKVKATHLSIRLGLSMKASNILVDELKKLF